MKIGCDLVEHNRIRNLTDEKINRLLSDDELKYYHTITNKKRSVEYVASRFAAKEAIFKAYKKGDGTFNYKDISVLNNEDGSPYIQSSRLNDKIEITISHTDEYSLAFVMVYTE